VPFALVRSSFEHLSIRLSIIVVIFSTLQEHDPIVVFCHEFLRFSYVVNLDCAFFSRLSTFSHFFPSIIILGLFVVDSHSKNVFEFNFHPSFVAITRHIGMH